METTETVKIEGEGLTVSLLVWRRFKKQMPGLVERIYAVNPGLSESGPFLPVGASFLLPIPAEKTGEQDVTPVRLWS